MLDALGPQWVLAFKLLLSYPSNTVGAWVEPRVLTLPDDCNAGEARERIASSALPAQARIYVLDRSRRIRGAIRGLSLLQVPSRRALTAMLEPAEALWAREPLGTAQEHGVWERNTEAPVINREEEFIGVISYTDLRKAHRQATRSVESNGRRDLAEVTELIAIGGRQPLAEPRRPDPPGARPMSAAADDVKKTALDAINRHFLLNHPAQAADVVDGFGKSAAVELLSEQEPDALAAVWRHLSPARIDEIVPEIPETLLKQSLHALDPSVLAVSLPRISDDARERCLTLLPRRTAAEVRRLMDYPPGSAGRVMDARAPSLPRRSRAQASRSISCA